MRNATLLLAAALLICACSKDNPVKLDLTMPAEMLQKLDFEHFRTEETKPSYGYHVFYEQGANDEKYNIWASGNAGAAIIKSKRKPEAFPTYASPEGRDGYCVCLTTQSAGSLGSLAGKPIAAGSLFLGNFNSSKALSNPLKTTEFGIPVDREPLSVSGWYKYTPGKTFTDKNKKEISGRTDEANIYGVFWRSQDSEGNQIVLHGDDILTSPYIISKAQVSALPPADEWTHFEMTFEGNHADPQVLEGKGCSFTLVFSSSKNGDAFEGAIGSTLLVDEVEVVFAD